MSAHSRWSRRRFVARTALGVAVWTAKSAGVLGAENPAPTLRTCPVAIFSKLFQELKLDYEASAEVVAEAGLDGIDCPVRPGGQVLPERVAEDLPRYVAALERHRRKVHLLTTGILNPSSPHAETILRTARQFGVKYYRLGYWSYSDKQSKANLLTEVRAQLKDLAALNRQLGVCGVYQNHSGGKNFGATLGDLTEVLGGLDPAHIGVAFDPSHAIIQIGDRWRDEFQKLRPYVKVAYVKDAKRAGQFVRFGDGELGQLGFFKLLKELKYEAPISMHTEYNWPGPGQPKTRARLVRVLQEDLAMLKRWLKEA